ncbi:hypothetical protein DWB84_17430 [Saccharophagus sp. K07]|nr:hypothetical protein [Saccharophagus sp. K07]
MRNCSPGVNIDTSSFWFLGAASISGLPLLAILTTPRKQKILLVSLAVWFVCAPIIAHQYFLSVSNQLSYDVGPAKSFFFIGETLVSVKFCTRDL